MPNSNGSIAASQYAKTVNYISLAGKMKIYHDPNVKKEKKKMGWFKKKFAQWAREAWENARNEDAYVAKDTIRAHEGVNGKTSVRFTIYPASGGYVIEHYKQDRYKDSEGPSLTIVNNGDDMGKAVEHILALEALKA